MIPCNSRVISLVRTPERLKSFRIRLNELASQVLWQPAIDGQSINLDDLIQTGTLSNDAASWPKGQIGCALSHLEAWRECQDSGEPMLIFEDDALFCKDWDIQLTQLMSSLPDCWDIFLLGWNQDSCLQWEWSPGFTATSLFRPRYPAVPHLQSALNNSNKPQVFKLLTGLGLAGYVVSAHGASRLLDWALPLRTLPIASPDLPTRNCYSLDGQLNSFVVGSNLQNQSLTLS